MIGRDLLRLKRAGPLAHPYVARLSRDSEFIKGATLASLLILALSGCATTPIPQPVHIRVPVSCIEALPELPAFLTDDKMSKLDDYDFVIELRVDQLNQRQHIEELRAILKACQ